VRADLPAAEERRVTDPDDPPRSPSGRVPKWVVDERMRDRIDGSGYVPGSAAVPRPGGARHRRPSVSLPAVVTAVVLVLVGWLGVRSLGGPASASAPTGTGTVTTAVPNAPPAGVDSARGRVLPALTPSVVSPAWKPFAVRTDAEGAASSLPVRWDPCRPIRYVVRPDGAPPGGADLLADAFRAVSAATGLSFVPDGTTDEPPSTDRAAYQPDRYGNRWAPVLVAWERAAENPALADDVAGQAGPTALRLGDRPEVYVTGVVELDADQLRALLATAQGRPVAREIVLHELGHLVGLGHVDERGEVMFPKVSAAGRTYGDGDLTGLAELGRGPCAPWL
jgi:hypothetical protein